MPSMHLVLSYCMLYVLSFCIYNGLMESSHRSSTVGMIGAGVNQTKQTVKRAATQKVPTKKKASTKRWTTKYWNQK